jgi:hypothetical protein
LFGGTLPGDPIKYDNNSIQFNFNFNLFISKEIYSNGPCKSRIYDLSTGTRKNNNWINTITTIIDNNNNYNNTIQRILICCDTLRGLLHSGIMSEEDYIHLTISLYNTLTKV